MNSRIRGDADLEIACGYGRWTQYLKEFCKDIVVVDLSRECIADFRRRFPNYLHIEDLFR
jgi:ubiquinone/menaquinone biosynthesis C-methylase UbiE